MTNHFMAVGTWIRFKANGGKTYVGFIEKHVNSTHVRVFIPSQRKSITIPHINVLNHESPRFTLEDIYTLIDVALDTKDSAWYDELQGFRKALEKVTPPA